MVGGHHADIVAPVPASLAGSVLGGGEGVLHAEFHGEDPVELGDASERDVVAVEVVVQEDSLGLCESVGQAERGLLASAADGHVGGVVYSCLVEFLPVHRVRGERRTFAVWHPLVSQTAVHFRTPTVTCADYRSVWLKVSLVAIVRCARSVDVLKLDRRLVDVGDLHCLVDLDSQTLLAVLAAFGDNHDRSVGPSGAVERCRRRSLEDGHALVVGRVEVLQLGSPVCSGQIARDRFLDDQSVNHEDRGVVLVHGVRPSDGD